MSTKHTLEIVVPAERLQQETERVAQEFQKQARLPGFRPGKAPLSLIRSRFRDEIRQEVYEHLLPKVFRERVEQENLQVVGSPRVTSIEENGEGLRFKAEFEVFPEITLGEYRNIPVEYEDPQVTDEEVEARLEEIRQQRAEFVNEDPRPLVDGDWASIELRSVAGVEGEPIENKDMSIQLGDADTLPEFTEHLRGMSPGEEKEFDVTYPDDYGEPRVAGKTIRFHVRLKAVRRRELPELNDEFAQDLGDFQTLDELRQAVRRSLEADKLRRAQQEAKEKIIDSLVASHDFPVPETFIERQIEQYVGQYLQAAEAQGVDPGKLRLNWDRIRESTRDRALRQVKAALLLDKIADAEGIYATKDEVEQEIQRIARSRREPVAAVRLRLEKEDQLGRIADAIRSEKTLNFLFENARKMPKAAA
jgi:trigger factor